MQRQRQHQFRNQNFEIYDDESERQLQQDLRSAEKKAFFKMADTKHESAVLSDSDDGESVAESLPLPEQPQGARNPMEGLMASLTSGKFSDLTVKHGKREWNAHRVVVCTQCPKLETEIVFYMGKHWLDLEKHDYEAVCLLMEYLYASNYTTACAPPDFSLGVHVKMFNLAVTLSFPVLEETSVIKFRHVLNNFINSPLIFFSAVRQIYSTPTPSHDGLRLAVLEAGISEMRKILQGPYKEQFFTLTREVREFQADMYLFMLEHPNRPMEVIAQDLCVECGPREEGDGYAVTLECEGCGQERTMNFQ